MRKKIGKYFSYYSKERSRIAVSIFLSVLQTATVLPVAILIQRLFDRVIPQHDTVNLFRILSAIAILFGLNALIILANRHITLRAIKSIIATIREQLLSNVLYLEKSYYTHEDLDTIHSRIVNDTERLDCMTSALLTQFIPSLLVVLGLAGLLLYLNPPLFLILSFSLPILYFLGKIVKRNVRRRIKKFHEDFSRFSKGVSFVLKFHDLIILSSAEKKENDRQRDYIQDLRQSSGRMAWLATAYTTIQGNIMVFGGIIILFVGGIHVMHETETIGTLISFYAATVLLASNVRIIVGAIPVIDEGRESLQVLSPLLDVSTNKLSTLNSFSGLKKSILFEEVSFEYGQGRSFKLQNINCVFAKGSITGIFGASGSGKSTILNLLLGLYSPTKGRILVDDWLLTNLDLLSYRRKIGILSQDPGFFYGTIRENLIYGLSSVNEEHLVKVCILTRIDNFVQTLPGKYETLLGDRGVSISGGQRQRLAIARALLRKPDILVLDEPDNNLDEEIIGEILKELKKENISIIVVSHNKRLQPFMDTAVFLYNGNAIQKSEQSYVQQSPD